ncbi:MAG: GTPase ObgE [Candidatus Margulisbacteria bacterium]|nr:GTPase ObgE [Candidatus Margulisiibacteriota bacterium]
MFIDVADILVKAGNGGKGCVSFRREKYIPRGGPDGGDGSKGGDIVVVADAHLKSLMDYQYKKVYKAQNGGAGEGRDRYGKKGEDITLKFPVGTTISNKETGETIVDLIEDKQEFVILRGGIGGKGNARFANSVNQTPYYAQPGLPGEEMKIHLELKLIADVGIIGLPNIGKSSLISRVTNARPKIADYEFTTLVPNLGVVNYKNDKQFVIADVPGIIENAHLGQGLGHQFLRHVERTRVLIHLLDVSDFKQMEPKKAYDVLNNELSLYNKDILEKKQLVVFNKIDVLHDRSILQEYSQEFDTKVFFISAVTGEGIEELMTELVTYL